MPSGTAFAEAGGGEVGPGTNDPAAVECVQRALGFDPGQFPYGHYGPATIEAVRAFQSREGIEPTTGIVGPRTGDRLIGLAPQDCARRLPTSNPLDPLVVIPEPAQPTAGPPTDPADATPACIDGSRDSARDVAQGTTVTEPVPEVSAGNATIKLRYSDSRRCVWGWVGGDSRRAVAWVESTRDIRRLPFELGGWTELPSSRRTVARGNENSFTAAFQLRDGVTFRVCGAPSASDDAVCTQVWPPRHETVPVPADREPETETREEITDRYLFDTTLHEFGSIREEKEHEDVLDWTDDECSNSPDRAFFGDFRPACRRHDFGYRNTKDQGRWDEDMRKRIDDGFLRDALNLCGEYEGIKHRQCQGAALHYHAMIRRFGGVSGGLVSVVTANPIPRWR